MRRVNTRPVAAFPARATWRTRSKPPSSWCNKPSTVWSRTTWFVLPRSGTFAREDWEERVVRNHFSPRIVLFNPGTLERCGLPPPSPHWDWDDFIRYVTTLRRHLPDGQVLNYGDHPAYWMSFIFRAGGRLFDRMPDGTVEVRVDLPETLRGLELIRELRSALRCPPRQYHTGPEAFLEGGMALAFTDREFCSRLWRERRTAWGAVPTVPGGRDAMAQSTNLVCVRRECTDTALASQYLQFMLGDDAQSFIADERYGLPIQKRAAMASVDAEDPRDTLFLSQMNQMSAEYTMDSPVMTSMLQDGLSRILWNDRPPEAELRRLTDAFRAFMDIRNARLRDEGQIASQTRRRSERRASKEVDAAMAVGATGSGL